MEEKENCVDDHIMLIMMDFFQWNEKEVDDFQSDHNLHFHLYRNKVVDSTEQVIHDGIENSELYNLHDVQGGISNHAQIFLNNYYAHHQAIFWSYDHYNDKEDIIFKNKNTLCDVN